MSLVSFVAGRYFRTRQKRAFISLITALSIAGVTIGVMALIVVISVMAGFERDLKSRIMGIRPHLVISKPDGDFVAYERIVQSVAPIAGVETAAAFIRTQVVLRTSTRAAGAILKGVAGQTDGGTLKGVDTHLLAPSSDAAAGRDGEALPPGIILGKELAAQLGLIRGDAVYIISPRGILSPAGHIPSMTKFRVVDLFASGMYEFDGSLAFVGLVQAQKLLKMGGRVSGIEIRLDDLDRVDSLRSTIQKQIGTKYAIADWRQMNRSLFSALQLEKTVMFIILALIILVAALNIAGSLVMMVMEKRKDIAILKTMGAPAAAIARIFVVKGLTIGLVGTLLGTGAGVAVCILLERYAFVRLPADVFYLSTIPVHLKASDVMLIAFSALLICFAATVYPARQAAGIDPVESLRHG